MLRKTKRNLHRPDKEKRKTLSTLSQSITSLLHPLTYVGPSSQMRRKGLYIEGDRREKKERKETKGYFTLDQSRPTISSGALCALRKMSRACASHDGMSHDAFSFSRCVRPVLSQRCSLRCAAALSVLCSHHQISALRADCPKNKEGLGVPPCVIL